MIQVGLLIFDLDGTLIDSRQNIVNAVNFTLRSLNLKEKPPAEIISHIGYGAKEMLGRCLYPENGRFLEKAVVIFEDYFLKNPVDKTILYPYVKEILEYFKTKNLVIVTNRSKQTSEAALKYFDIIDYFKYIITGDDETCLKPSACPLNRAFDNFDVEKKKSMIIGDMALDILAGKNAGILTCAVTYGIGKIKDLLAAKPDYVIDGIIELKKLIRK